MIEILYNVLSLRNLLSFPFMCMCVCITSVCHTCAGDFGETKDCGSLEAEVTGGFELPDVGAS